MSDEKPTPADIEEDKAKGRMLAGIVRDHYEALRDSGFAEDEAFQLAENFHWYLLTDQEPE